MVHYVNRFQLGDDATLAGVLADYEAASAETDKGPEEAALMGEDTQGPGGEVTGLEQVHEQVQWFTTQRLVWLAGFVLIAAGIVCLYLSDKVAKTSWTQGTLDAFGVGFIVGGLVDVLAIFGLTQVLAGDQRRRANDFEAEAILRARGDAAGLRARGAAARALLIRSGRQIDPHLRDQLEKLADAAYPEETAVQDESSDA
jgi:hypothetical protein